MIDLYRKFEELKNCTKKKSKEEYLISNKDDTLFCFVLEFLLNSHKKTGISNKKIEKTLDVEHESFNNIKSLITYVINNPTGKDTIVASVQDFINSITNFIIREFIKDIITKKYKIGCTAKFVADILPDVVAKEFSVRKGYYLDDPEKQLKGREFIVTTKYDGFRTVVIKRNATTIDIYSSGGHLLEGLKEIELNFTLPDIPIGVYDGEMLAIDNIGFSNSTERYQATEKILLSKGNKSGLEFKCFDYISDIEAFESFNIIDMPCKERKSLLEKILMFNGKQLNPFIQYVEPLYIGTDIDEIYSAYDNLIEQGEEGVIIDISSAPHIRKKGTMMFKLKEINTLDLPIVDLQEGTGKYKGTLGAFVCQYKETLIPVSGMTDEIRNDAWVNKDKYIGQIIEVHCQKESENQNGVESLRQPRFKRFREKGKTPSYE